MIQSVQANEEAEEAFETALDNMAQSCKMHLVYTWLSRASIACDGLCHRQSSLLWTSQVEWRHNKIPSLWLVDDRLTDVRDLDTPVRKCIIGNVNFGTYKSTKE